MSKNTALAKIDLEHVKGVVQAWQRRCAARPGLPLRYYLVRDGTQTTRRSESSTEHT